MKDVASGCAYPVSRRTNFLSCSAPGLLPLLSDPRSILGWTEPLPSTRQAVGAVLYRTKSSTRSAASILTTSFFIPFYVGDSSSQILVTPSTRLNNSCLFFSSLIASCTTLLLCSATCRLEPVFGFVVALRIQKNLLWTKSPGSSAQRISIALQTYFTLPNPSIRSPSCRRKHPPKSCRLCHCPA